MKKIALAVLITLLIIGIITFVRLSAPIKYNIISNNLNNLNQSYTNLAEKSSGKINLLDLALHNKATDCWVGYSGKIYDITSFLPGHPGSAGAISPYCGTSKEFTDAFTKKHGTKKVGLLMKVGVLIGDFEIRGSV